ncbi:hypothetical protein C3F09_04000 [candidate division GN15 bacterium]|uniref:Glycerophosphoryl diester phosphodiesterase membrane domain-containing protein n=1 Tax=candidate division GN15 bacterium TaxID=2072418 RepID=A0A855X8C5_9BACT|nr:MAG: hypothetical protein C3F09_04000 [candidate division GN15 bacterium]
MRIGDLVSRSWDIAFKYKSLWLLGLLAEGAWFGTWIRNRDSGFKFGDSDLLFSGMAVALVFAILILMLVLLVLHFISVAGLIDSVNRITRGGKYELRLAFASGIRVFWRYVGLWLLAVMAGIALVVALAIPVALGFVIHAAFGIIAVVLLLPVLLIGIFITYNVYALTQRSIVVRDCSIGDALSEAYWLFRRNLGPNLAVFLVYMVLAIAITLAAVILILLVAAPFVAMALSSTGGKIMALLLGVPLVLVLLLIIEGISGVFLNCLYTLFYFGLVEPDGLVAPQPQDTPPA